MAKSQGASWMLPALILFTSFIAPLAYVDVEYVSHVRAGYLVFPVGAFKEWSNYTGPVPAMPIEMFPFPFDLALVYELALVWVALGAVLSLAVQRDLERSRRSVSLIISLIILVIQIFLPFLFFTITKYPSVSSYHIIPLPIPSVTSLMGLLYISRGPSGRLH